jgi:bis(5'-nucleosyl)-tetraphosphatase (symmetrical)
VDAKGRLVLRAKGSPKKVQSKSLIPWFEAQNACWHGARIIFGHWSTLGYFKNAAVTGLDTGCVWGDRLTALRLDEPDADPVQVACRVPRGG